MTRYVSSTIQVSELPATPYVDENSFPPSPCNDDDDDKVSTALEPSIKDYNINFVVFTPIIACHGATSQAKSTIRHVQISTITTPTSPNVTVPSPAISPDKPYSEPRSLKIPNDYFIQKDNSSPIPDNDWKTA